MRKFDKGDVVLCKKFDVCQKMVFTKNGMMFEPYIEKSFFDRKAYISKTYKEYMDKILNVPHKDEDKYEITFLDNSESLAWVNGDDLISLLK